MQSMSDDAFLDNARPWTRLLLAAAMVLCLALLAATAAPVPLPAMALFHRITPANSTRHAHRAQLTKLAREEPGVLMAAAAARLGIDFHSAQHHARVLQRCGLVDVVKIGRNVALYPRGCVSFRQRAALVHLRRGPQAAMLDLVARHPGLRVGDLAALAGCTKSSASAKLSRLRGLGLVERAGGLHCATALARETWPVLGHGTRLGEVPQAPVAAASCPDGSALGAGVSQLVGPEGRGAPPPPKPEAARAYMAEQQALREAYWDARPVT